MKRFQNYKTEGFFLDQEFINWVLNPDKTSDKKWAGFLNSYPQKKSRIEEAAYLLMSAMPVEPEITDEKLLMLWARINEKKKFIKRRKQRIRILKSQLRLCY